MNQNGEQVDAYIRQGEYMRASSLLNRQIKQQPLDWTLYARRAQLELADLEDRDSAAESFRTARFVEPNLAYPCLEEGFAWLAYDQSSCVAAWRECLLRASSDRMKDFERMVAEGLENPMLMNRLSILSEMEPDFRVYFLTRLNSGGFERELRRELEVDPDLLNYTQEQRSELLMHWMNHADLASAEAFLLKHESDLSDPWRLWAECRKSGPFQEAVELVRESLVVPVIRHMDYDEAEFAAIERGFSLVPSDLSRHLFAAVLLNAA